MSQRGSPAVGRPPLTLAASRSVPAAPASGPLPCAIRTAGPAAEAAPGRPCAARTGTGRDGVPRQRWLMRCVRKGCWDNNPSPEEAAQLLNVLVTTCSGINFRQGRSRATRCPSEVILREQARRATSEILKQTPAPCSTASLQISIRFYSRI